MAGFISLKDRINKTDQSSHSNPSGSSARRSNKDPNVIAIQQFIINNSNFPIGNKKNEKEPDGGYGPITHSSLKQLLQGTYQDPMVKQTIDAILKSQLVKDTYDETIRSLPHIAAIIAGKGQPRTKGDIQNLPTNQYIINIEIPGNNQPIKYDLSRATRSLPDFEYSLVLLGLLDRAAAADIKQQQIIAATRIILNYVPETLAVTRSTIADFAQKLEEQYISSNKGPLKALDQLRAADPYLMGVIPQGNQQAENRLLAQIRFLNPKVIDGDGNILDMGAFKRIYPDIGSFLQITRRNLEGRNAR